jgi:hypothetical protein
VIDRLPRGARLPVSDRMVKDVFGDYWFKTRLESGAYGYIPAKAIRTTTMLDEQRNAGLQEREIDRVDGGDVRWTYVLRAMVAGGMALSGGTIGMGGEGELTFTPFLNSEGYDRRKLSVGGFFQLAGETTAFGASAVYRIFSPKRFEPEFRLRAGMISAEGESAFGAGACVGVRYPFTMSGGRHFAAYAEGQSFIGFSASTSVLVSLALGLGYHF